MGKLHNKFLCNTNMIMSYLAKVEMFYFRDAIMPTLKGGQYGRKGHYQDEPGRSKTVMRDSEGAKSREINQVKAAEILSLSDRQIRRIVNWKKTCKSRRHYQWRERKHYFGEMVQMDGSQHDWLEGRAPACVFMGYIDDATGNAFGRFYPPKADEGTMPP